MPGGVPMLRMKPVGKGEQGAKKADLYYQKTDSGYYRGEGGLHCEWGGKGSPMLSLEGPPDYEHFKRLIRGLDPHSGEQLTARLRDDRIPCWDVTASIPKRVTIALERGDSRIQAKLWESVREAMAMLEQYASTRIRIDGQQDDRVTGNLLWYAVEHPDTRPVENEALPEDHQWRVMPLPDRHVHIVIPNLTWDDEEKQWKAVKFRPIMDLRKYFDRCFDSIFAYKLSHELGYALKTEFRDDAKGNSKYYSWDIDGMPAPLVAGLSKRSQEIDDLEKEIVAERKKLDKYAPDHLSAVEKDKLGATSRRVKRDDLTLEDCREYWQTLFAEWADDIDDVIRRAKLGLNPKPQPVLAKAVDFSMRHHFERESALAVEELVTTALEHAMGGARPEDVVRELKRQGVILVQRNGKTLATTKELMREEEALASFAAAGRGTCVPIGLDAGLTRQLATGETLSDGQWEAARGLLESQNRVNMVLGPAGAGKSKLLKKVEEGAKLAGKQIVLLGTTSTSVKVLKKDGFEGAQTVEAFLLSEKMQAAARGGWVIVDEASIHDHKAATRLFEVAKNKNLKLIYLGDNMQHGSIGRGNFIRLMTEHGRVIPFRLTEILRQKDLEYRAAAQLLSEGKTVEGFNSIDKMGWVSEIAHGEDRCRHIAADYVQSLNDGVKWNDMLVVAPTHREAGFITGEIREQLREAGKLGDDEREFTRLVAVDASEAERGLASTYRPGDVIQFHQNAKGGYVKGQRIVVDDPAKLPLSQAARFSLYREEKISLAEGDVIRGTGRIETMGSDHVIKNGDVHAVAGFTKAGNIRLDNGWVIDGKAAQHFRSGFVDTSIGSQGRTVRRVLLGMSSAMGRAVNMQQLYVSSSRAWERMRVYTDNKEDARESIQLDSRKLIALDLKEGAASDPTERDRQEKQRLEDLARRQRRSVYDRFVAAWTPRPSSGRVPPMPPVTPTSRPMGSHSGREQARERERGQSYGR
jgi:conjugative relaxase-like TrwC/TraI family protein